jgi:hypothetical protein
MKKLISILCLLYLCASCSTSKQTITIQSLKFKLLKESVKIKAQSLSEHNKKDEKVILLKNIYKAKDVLIGISDPLKDEIKKDLLKNHKFSHDYDMKSFELIEIQQYQSKLETINGNEVLYFYTYYEDVGEYSFRMVSKDYTQIFSGRIVFEKQSDYEEATKILNDLLNSVDFE